MRLRLKGLIVEVVAGDITLFQGDALVNPANTYGYMGGGVALAIRKKGGDVIEEEAVKQAPIPIGGAVVTTGGSLGVKAVIHAPTVVEPGGASSPVNVYKATAAALSKVLENGFRKIAFPLMGAGVGGVPPAESARAMARALREHGAGAALTIHVYVRDPGLVGDVVRAFIEEGFQPA